MTVGRIHSDRPARAGSLCAGWPARRSGAFTLIELLVVVAIIALLTGLLVPTFSQVRSSAKMTLCATQMRRIGSGLIAYATDNDNQLPPFAFSSFAGNLPVSGHWGGAGAGGRFGTRGTESVNLRPLVSGGMLAENELICPGAASAEASCFPAGEHFSSYCLRMPYSEGLFASGGELANWRGRGLLGVYSAYGGGQECPVASAGGGAYAVGSRLTVPQVRIDRRYSEIDPGTGTEEIVDVMAGPILADMFWYQARTVTTGDGSEAAVGWPHGEKFNALTGSGAVHRISDDGTVAANSNPSGQELADDGEHWASYAIKVWRHFSP